MLWDIRILKHFVLSPGLFLKATDTIVGFSRSFLGDDAKYVLNENLNHKDTLENPYVFH